MVNFYSNLLIFFTFILFLSVVVLHAVPAESNKTEIENQTLLNQALPKLSSLNVTQVNNSFNLKDLTNKTEINVNISNVALNFSNEKSLVDKWGLNYTENENETRIEKLAKKENITLEQKANSYYYPITSLHTSSTQYITY